MSIQRPLGPIGHCSAKVRRLLAIDEEEALRHTVRIQTPENDRKERGNRWTRSADFSVPGAFYQRFMSADGRVTFHCELQAVTKTRDGGCRITTAKGSKKLGSGAPSEHDGYIERPDAVERTILPAKFDTYTVRSSAVEGIDETAAIFSNIAETRKERQQYWRAVHLHERTPGQDRLSFAPAKASRAAWQRLAETPDLPEAVRKMADAFSAAKGKRQERTIPLASLMLDRKAARALTRALNVTLGTAKGKNAVRLSEGRGGRSQYRLTVEFPEGLGPAERIAVTQGFCRVLADNGLMYVAAVHAPDTHNDRRNHHLHIAFHDRPARRIDGQWDFEIAEAVPGQSGRVRYPHRQNKVGDWARDPDGGNHRAHGSAMLADMRGLFADLCNEQLDRLGVTRKFHSGDMRSLGCEREPQEPLGTRAAPLEAAGVVTAAGIRNAEKLWTGVLQEAVREAAQRAKERAALRRRLQEAQARAAEGTLHAGKIQELADRLDHADVVLCAHESELAEYDTTLAMAQARPAKALATCQRLLSAVADGKAPLADERARHSIAKRAREAQVFLSAVAIADRSNTPTVTEHRDAVSQATADVIAIMAVTGPLLKLESSNERAILEGLFERIMAQDLPIHLPDKIGGGYRVPGITREEWRAISSAPLADMAQKRLEALAILQRKRMRAAAHMVATASMAEIKHAASQGSPSAKRTLKHVRAYADHPVYVQALNAAMVERPAKTTPTDPDGRRPTGWSSFRNRMSALLYRNPTLEPVPIEELATELGGEVKCDKGAVSACATTSRDEAIAALATALHDDPAIRVVDRDGHLVIDTSGAPDWQISADVFADEPVIAAAARDRFNSPWLDMAAADREHLLVELAAALRSVDQRPITRLGRDWRIDLADSSLADLVTRWRGFDRLEPVLLAADRAWSAREDRSAVLPTSVQRKDVSNGQFSKKGSVQIAPKLGASPTSEWSVEQLAQAASARGASR